jgi:hypothetical protein
VLEFALGDPLLGAKCPYGACDSDGKVSGIEILDFPDAAPAVATGLPERFPADAVRRNATQSGDDNATTLRRAVTRLDPVHGDRRVERVPSPASIRIIPYFLKYAAFFSI